MPQYTDQTGRNTFIQDVPKRIVSLVPSVTELLFDLGLDGRVVGITKFCVRPEHWFRSLTKVGGTKNPDPDKIRDLSPDLIIANKEENRKEDIEAMAEEFPVWVCDVRNSHQAFQMISDIGTITQTENRASEITGAISSSFSSIVAGPRSKCIYLIWWNPMMAVSSDTFIHDMINLAGFENLTASATNRYPILTESDIRALNPDFILASSEPFPFKDAHLKVLQEMAPGARILTADGEIFSWYGSRMLRAADYFNVLRRQLSDLHG